MPVVPFEPGYVETSPTQLSRREWYHRARTKGWGRLQAFFNALRHGG